MKITLGIAMTLGLAATLFGGAKANADDVHSQVASRWLAGLPRVGPGPVCPTGQSCLTESPVAPQQVGPGPVCPTGQNCLK